MREKCVATAALFATLAVPFMSAILAFPFGAQSSQRGGISDTTLKAVSAANAFLATLNDAQRAKVNLQLNKTTRSNWSNLPTGTVFQNGATERNGVKFGAL